MKKLLLGLLCLLPFLTACQRSPHLISKPTIELRWLHEEKLPYLVSSLKVVATAPAPLSGTQSYVQDRLTQSPAQAIYQWAQDKLTVTPAAGNQAELHIYQANILESYQEANQDFSTLFKEENNYLYEGTLEFELKILNNKGQVIKTHYAKSSAHSEASEYSTLAEREQLWFSLMEKMVHLATNEINKQI